jgi:hypothetical protein
MSKLVILDNRFAIVWYYEEQKIVHHQFKTYVNGAPFREVLLAGCELFEKHHAVKWLSDDREAKITPEDLRWCTLQWRERVLAAGWKYWALVLPEKFSGKVSMMVSLEALSSRGVVTETFTDPQEAFDWLEERT